MIYRVTLGQKDGTVIIREMEAESLEKLREALLAQDLYLIEAVEAGGLGYVFREFLEWIETLFFTKELINFTRLFNTSLRAGLPVTEILEILAEQTSRKSFRKVLQRIRQDVMEGVGLSAAFAKYPRFFSEFYVRSLLAGEKSGALERVLSRLVDYYEKRRTALKKFLISLIIPGVYMIIAFIAVIFLLTFLVPRFEIILTQMEVPMPVYTQFVIALAFIAKRYFLLIAVAATVAFYFFKQWHSTEQGKTKVDSFLLRIPVLGELIRKTSISSFSRTSGTLISSGIPVMEALTVSRGVIGNSIINRKVAEITEMVEQGNSLAESFEHSGMMPRLVTRMISVGEETGTLDQMFDQIADYYEEEVDTLLSGVVLFIEPVLMLGVALVFVFIILAMFMPLLTATMSMSQ